MDKFIWRGKFIRSNTFRNVKIIEEVINYLDKEIQKETERIQRILPEISYAIVGISILLFIIIVLIPFIQIYLDGLLFI